MRGKAANAQRSAQAEEIGAVSTSEPLVCEKTFAAFCRSLFPKDVHEAVLLHLVEGDMRLLRIAGARARKDCAAAAQEANHLARMAGTLGLFQAAALARQLEETCLAGGQGSTYGLIGRLSDVFQNSGNALEALLQRGTKLDG
jgi:HPt (histidine-containing phosphotransfer) domain-containing protein